MFDYSKLRGRIREKFKTEGSFADRIGMSPRTLSLKLSGLRDWTSSEMYKALEALELASTDAGTYFFTLQVQ